MTGTKVAGRRGTRHGRRVWPRADLRRYGAEWTGLLRRTGM